MQWMSVRKKVTPKQRNRKKLDGPTTVRFIVDITVWYGVPNSIITDNGTNFAKGALARYASQTGIRLDVASVAHPQSNGQAERANGLILSGIKPRLVAPLEKAPGAWIDELPAVLWSLRLRRTVQLDSPHSSLYTTRRQLSPRILSLIHLGTPCTRKQKPRKLVRTEWI